MTANRLYATKITYNLQLYKGFHIKTVADPGPWVTGCILYHKDAYKVDNNSSIGENETV